MESLVKILTFLLPLSLFALAKPELVSGSAHPKGDYNTVEVADRTILHYQTFDIGKDETVTFKMPRSDSTLMCRIRGEGASRIEGKLNANGRLFLINPQGIIFSETAAIHVGSLIASTADIRNDDFLKGRFHFALAPGAKDSYILHAGEIVAEESVVLFAPKIQKVGPISAKMGKILLLGASILTLDFEGDQKISFVLEGPLSEGGDIIAGKFNAKQVRVELKTAAQIVQKTLQCDGLVEAGSIAIENGVIRLVEGKEKTVSSTQGTFSVKAACIDQAVPVSSKGAVDYAADRIVIGGHITTSNTPITLDGPVCLVNKDAILFKTGFVKGDVIFGSTLDADKSSSILTVQNGNGKTHFKGDIGKNGPLGGLNVNSGKIVFHGDIGGEKGGITGALKLNLGEKLVYCQGAVYHAGEQHWNSAQIHLMREGAVQIQTDGGPLCFNQAELLLKKTTALSIGTKGGRLELAPLIGESLQSVTIVAGEAHLKEVGGNLSKFHLEAQNISIAGQIEAGEIFLEAESHLLYQEDSILTAIKSSGKVTLNSKQASVGSFDRPLVVQTEDECFIGARVGVYLTGDFPNLPKDYLKNPPPIKFFNKEPYADPIDEENSLNSLLPALSWKKRATFINTGVVQPKSVSIYYQEK